MRATALQTPRQVRKGREEVLQLLDLRFPCSQWRSTGEQKSTCRPWRAHSRARGCPKVSVTPWEAHAGAGSWQDLWALGERCSLWNRFFDRFCGPCEVTLEQLFLQGCIAWKGLTLEQFVKNCCLWDGLMLDKSMEDCPHAGAREGLLSLRTKWQDKQHHELYVTPSPHLPALLWLQYKIGNKVKPRKEGVVGGRCF